MGPLELDQQAAGPKHVQLVGLFAVFVWTSLLCLWEKKAFASDSILEDIDQIV